MKQLTIAYGVDIGVYKTTASDMVKATTTFAWARLDAATGAATTSKNLPDLVTSMRADLSRGSSLAIGFEAPMWFRVDGPAAVDGEKRLFRPRFPAEKEYPWYAQSGAAATMKSMVFGIRLLGELAELGAQLTVNPEHLVRVGLVCFEGFVVGDAKDAAAAASARWGLHDTSSDERDAAGVADAWLSVNQPGESARAKVLHRWSDQPDSDIVSIWAMMAHRGCDLDGSALDRRACQVLMPAP